VTSKCKPYNFLCLIQSARKDFLPRLCTRKKSVGGFLVSGQSIQYAFSCVTTIIYKACSKKDRIFAINTLFYIILSTVHSTGDTPFLTFLPLLECFLERTLCDGVQFCYSIFLNLRVFKKRPNFLNSSPTSTEGALRLLSAPSGRF
jgi:hypothetical protein